jgi:hypothetical protein
VVHRSIAHRARGSVILALIRSVRRFDSVATVVDQRGNEFLLRLRELLIERMICDFVRSQAYFPYSAAIFGGATDFLAGDFLTAIFWVFIGRPYDYRDMPPLCGGHRDCLQIVRLPHCMCGTPRFALFRCRDSGQLPTYRRVAHHFRKSGNKNLGS